MRVILQPLLVALAAVACTLSPSPATPTPQPDAPTLQTASAPSTVTSPTAELVTAAPTSAAITPTATAQATIAETAKIVTPAPSVATQPAPPGLSAALTMTTGRATHTATLLADGRVLIAGGFRQEGRSEVPIASAEIYDPVSNTFQATGDLKEPRDGHVAALLPDGQVLIAGGWGLDGRIATAELFDPRTGQFRSTGSLATPRQGMTATVLPDGRVLIAGGDSARNVPQKVLEIYDPALGRFEPAGQLVGGRSAHTASLLGDGRVLLAGGHAAGTVLATAELYDPRTGQSTPTGGLARVRYKHASVLLKDGRVLVLGGSNQDDWRGQYSTAELYDPERGSFAPASDLEWRRFKLADAALLMENGDVLVGGGNRHLEVYEASSSRFRTTGQLDGDYFYTVLTILQSGRVLITGGYDANIRPSEKAWIYN